jgi:hypothetical protein
MYLTVKRLHKNMSDFSYSCTIHFEGKKIGEMKFKDDGYESATHPKDNTLLRSITFSDPKSRFSKGDNPLLIARICHQKAIKKIAKAQSESRWKKWANCWLVTYDEYPYYYAHTSVEPITEESAKRLLGEDVEILNIKPPKEAA